MWSPTLYVIVFQSFILVYIFYGMVFNDIMSSVKVCTTHTTPYHPTLSWKRLFRKPGQRNGLLYNHSHDLVSHSVSHPHLSFALQFCQAQMVWYGSSSKKNRPCWKGRFRTFLISKGIKIASVVKKLWQLCWMSRFCLLVELHQEGFAINLANPSSLH